MRALSLSMLLVVLGGCGSDEGERQTSDATGTDTSATPDVVDTANPADVDVPPNKCLIDGQLYDDQAPNRDNPCEACRRFQNPLAWTYTGDGSRCGDGICSPEGCVDQCFIQGAFYARDAGQPDKACYACLPDTNRYNWQAQADGTLCEGGTCIGTACIDTPLIAGVTPACAPNDGSGVVRLEVRKYSPTGGHFEVAGLPVTSAVPDGRGNFDVGVPVSRVTGMVDVSAHNAGGAPFVLPAALELFAGFGLQFSQRATTDLITAAAVGDVDGDRHEDVAYIEDGTLFVERGGQSDGTFAHLDRVSDTRFADAVAVGDLTDDGLADIVVIGELDIFLFKGVADQVPAFWQRIATNVDWRAVVLGRFDIGTTLDIALVASLGEDVHIYTQSTQGVFTAQPSVTVGPTLTQLYAANVGGDERDDLVVVTYEPGRINVALASGSGFAPFVTSDVDAPQTVSLADFDGDGDVDALVTGASRVSTSMYLNSGAGTFVLGQQLTTGGLSGAVAGDFNGDFRMDVVGSGGLGARFIAGHGDGTFACAYEVPLQPSPYQWFAADLDGDSHLDVVGRDALVKTLIHGVSNR